MIQVMPKSAVQRNQESRTKKGKDAVRQQSRKDAQAYRDRKHPSQRVLKERAMVILLKCFFSRDRKVSDAFRKIRSLPIYT